jgi:hypothetical protein
VLRSSDDRGAFQANAFQTNAFQITDEAAPPAVVVAIPPVALPRWVELPLGGFHRSGAHGGQTFSLCRSAEVCCAAAFTNSLSIASAVLILVCSSD